MEKPESVSPAGLSIWFGHHPPESAHLSVIHVDAAGSQRVVHLSLMDLAPFTDDETKLTGPEVLNLLGRMTARFLGTARATDPD